MVYQFAPMCVKSESSAGTVAVLVGERKCGKRGRSRDRGYEADRGMEKWPSRNVCYPDLVLEQDT